jgi:hypothetical protein
MSFMACSLKPTVAVDISYWGGNAPLDQEKVGGRYAADLIPQLPARGSGSVTLCTPRLQVAPDAWLTPLHAGMK